MTDASAKIVASVGDFTVHRRLAREAYARNGNAYNPTPEYSYTLYCDGRPVSSPFRRLKDARAAALEWSQQESP